MPRSYMSHIKWELDLSKMGSAEDNFSSKRLKKIRQSLTRMEEAGYRFEFHDVTAEFLDQFLKIYIPFIGAKHNAKIYDVKGNIMKKQEERGRRYEALTLWKDSMLVGTVIYARKKETFSVAYRVFPSYLDSLKLSASPANVSELLLTERALAEGKSRIVHGRDRNAYGMNVDIGLAIYKMRLNAVPHISRSEANEVLELPVHLEQDTMVFMGIEPGKACTEVVLYTNLSEEEVRAKYATIYSYDQMPVRVEPR